jgi:hypothetical protein
MAHLSEETQSLPSLLSNTLLAVIFRQLLRPLLKVSVSVIVASSTHRVC